MLQKLQPFEWTCALATIATLLSSAAYGKEIYVNNRSGRDIKIGSGPVYDSGLPLLTIQAAVDRALPGDQIVLIPTDLPYREEVVFPGSRLQGHSVLPIVLEGNGCTMDGTLPVPVSYWQPLGDRQFAFEGAFFGRRPLFLDGQTISPASLASWGPAPKLDAGHYIYWQGKLLFQAASDRWINDYPLSVSELRCAILVHRANHVIVRNLRIRGYYQDGIQVRGPVHGVRIESCQLTQNGRAGLSVINNAEAKLVGSFVEKNVISGVVNQEFSHLALIDSTISANPQESLTDGSSHQSKSGGTPKPLPEGPFILPFGLPGKAANLPAAPGEEDEIPAERKPQSFFDEQ